MTNDFYCEDCERNSFPISYDYYQLQMAEIFEIQINYDFLLSRFRDSTTGRFVSRKSLDKKISKAIN